MDNEYTVGSLFAGVGGICMAFKNAGFQMKWANEFDKNACITYRENFNHTLYEEDIHKITNPKEMGEVDILTAGFPCQAFSVAGYRKGFNDERGNLFFETARFIDELRPKAFLLENVKNLAGHDGGKTLRVIKETLTKDLGYSFYPFILNSKDFGNIPQTRERLYMVGFRDESHCEYSEEGELIFLNGSDDSVSCASQFNEPGEIVRSKTIQDLLFSEKQDDKYYYGKDHNYYKHLNSEMKSRKTIYQWRRVYVRENKSNLCPTLTANMGTGGHNVPLIKDKFGFRKLTPRECFRFMGFADNFKLPIDMANSHLYKQAGNSVVVTVVQRIAKRIKRALDVNLEAGRKIA